MPQEWAAFLGAVIGAMLTVWSVFAIYKKSRQTSEERARGVRWWIIFLMLLLGLGELSGSLRKLLKLLE